MKDQSRRIDEAEPNKAQIAVPSCTPRSERLGLMYQHAIALLVDRLALSRLLAVVDLETSGVSVDRDRIVQIGIIRVEPSGDYDELDRLVNPEMPIPP